VSLMPIGVALIWRTPNRRI